MVRRSDAPTLPRSTLSRSTSSDAPRSPPGAQRILWLLHFGRGILLERFEDFVNGAFELGVAAFGLQRRIINHRDVRVHAVALDDPLTLGAVNAKSWHRDRSAINERRGTGDADQSAPGACADQRAQARLLEVKRETIAARPAPAVYEHGF